MAGSLLTPHILLPTSYFLLPTSYFLLPTSYFLLFTTFYLDEITCRMYCWTPERGQVLPF
jgi:hypothetical protein